jgi:two-component system response regulator
MRAVAKKIERPNLGSVPLTQLGAVVRAHRQRLGISQEELAWRAGLHRSYIADIERGARNLTLRSMTNLAKALEISLASLARQADGPGDRSDSPAVRPPSGTLGEILLVEDNATDAELVVRSFHRARLANRVIVVRDGAKALDYLLGPARPAKGRPAAKPQLVLLDLKLPQVSGLEVLRRLKADPRTKDIPVVVLTVSRLEADTAECLRLGASDYMVKPVDFEKLCRITSRLNLDWALLTPSSVLRRPEGAAA